MISLKPHCLKVGILGYGRLGKMMIRYCWGFGMYPAVYDPYKEYTDDGGENSPTS